MQSQESKQANCHIKENDMKACPQCNELLIFPRNSECYCEECGYPDEDRSVQTQRQAHEEAAGMNLADSFFKFNNIDPKSKVERIHGI